MNIILCDKNCKYQKDGYCNLKFPSSITNSNNDECVFFSNKHDQLNEPTKQSILNNIEKTK